MVKLRRELSWSKLRAARVIRGGQPQPQPRCRRRRNRHRLTYALTQTTRSSRNSITTKLSPLEHNMPVKIFIAQFGAFTKMTLHYITLHYIHQSNRDIIWNNSRKNTSHRVGFEPMSSELASKVLPTKLTRWRGFDIIFSIFSWERL